MTHKEKQENSLSHFSHLRCKYSVPYPLYESMEYHFPTNPVFHNHVFFSVFPSPLPCALLVKAALFSFFRPHNPDARKETCTCYTAVYGAKSRGLLCHKKLPASLLSLYLLILFHTQTEIPVPDFLHIHMHLQFYHLSSVYFLLFQILPADNLYTFLTFLLFLLPEPGKESQFCLYLQR